MKDISATKDLEEIKELAIEVFNSEDMANQWLSSYNIRIGNTPLSLLNTECGADEVKRILAAIAQCFDENLEINVNLYNQSGFYFFKIYYVFKYP